MRCPTCGNDCPTDKRFCADCGAALTIGCVQCGAENTARGGVCAECGAALGESLASLVDAFTEADFALRTASKPSRATTPVEGERRHLTVLFSDLVDSTRIAGQLDPEEWHGIAAQYQRVAGAAIERLGGHVAKYLGDGVVAYFGWPTANEDDAERAVRAGLGIVDAVAALNRRLAVGSSVKLSVRVGIDSGAVVIGEG